MKRKAYLATLTLAAVLTIGSLGNVDLMAQEAAEEEVSKEEALDAAEEAVEEAEKAVEEAEAAEEAVREAAEAVEEAAEEVEKAAEKAEETAAADEEEVPDRLVSVDDVTPYVNIAEYKGIVLENMIGELTEADIDYQIQQNLSNAKEAVTEGTVENGDVAVIDYVGTKDGVEFPGGAAEGYSLTIGSGQFIPGFEDGVIGMAAGETKDITLTFPEDYWNEELAGAEVVFKVTVESFSRIPVLTDAWVAANTEVDTVEEYREVVREQVNEMYSQALENMKMQLGWNEVYTNSEIIEYPQEDYDKAYSFYHDLAAEYAGQGGMELSEFLESQGMTEEDLNTQSDEYAKNRVSQNLIIQGIMDAEGLSLEDPEMEALTKLLLDAYGVQELFVLEEEYGKAAIHETLALLRVEKFIADNATIAEPEAEPDAAEEVPEEGTEETDAAEEAVPEAEAVEEG